MNIILLFHAKGLAHKNLKSILMFEIDIAIVELQQCIQTLFVMPAHYHIKPQ